MHGQMKFELYVKKILMIN